MVVEAAEKYNEFPQTTWVVPPPHQPRPSLTVRSHRSTSTPTRQPLIVSDATVITERQDSSKNFTMDFTPPKYVQDMHAAPRFGHTNRLGKLASMDPEDAVDYAEGLKQFSLFVVVPFVIWAIILVLFKFLYGISKIGCAAGGEVLDMKLLSKAGISRKQRKKRILRSWRLHTAFMICGVFVSSASLLMMRNGWSKVQVAWEEVQEIVDDVESFGFQGWNVLEGLKLSRDSFFNNQLVRGFLDHKAAGTTSTLFSKWCPNATGDGQLAFLHGAMSDLEDQTDEILAIFTDDLPLVSKAFLRITESTHSVDKSLQWFFDHDWIWKMYIMILNVLNAFLLLCVYIFSKNNIVHPPTRFYLTFFVVPLFSVATGLLLIVTAGSGVATLMNADFCAGGSDQGSPQGTIRDAILSFYHGTLVPKKSSTGNMALVYDSFNYYAEGCLSENPLGFFENYSAQIDAATAFIVDLSETMPKTPETVDLLSSECGMDMSFLPEALVAIESDVLKVQRFMNSLVDMLDCHSISPLIRRLTHGAVCRESAAGLTWIWGCSLFICMCCFVMLTTRAALYNSMKKRKKREKKPKRVVEKEFEEYKAFMIAYYDDAPEWKIQGEKRTGILEIDFGQHIQSIPTLETERMSAGTDNHSEDAGILSIHSSSSGSSDADNNKNEVQPETQEEMDRLNLSQHGDDKDGGDSYDSDYESDSDASEGSDGGDDESALLSFYSETKSILSETKSILSEAKSKVSEAVGRAMANLRSVKPLLGKALDDSESSEGGEPIQDDRLYMQSAPVTRDNDTSENDCVVPPNSLSTSGLKPPSAPVKRFPFWGRTTPRLSGVNELEASTKATSNEARATHPLGESLEVRPRRLALSLPIDALSLPPVPLPERKVPCAASDAVVKESKMGSKPAPSIGLDLSRRDPQQRPSFANLMTRHRSDSGSDLSRNETDQRARMHRRPSFLNLMTRPRGISDDFSVTSGQEVVSTVPAEGRQLFPKFMNRQRLSSDDSSVLSRLELGRRAREGPASLLNWMVRPRSDSDDISVISDRVEPGPGTQEQGLPSLLNHVTRKHAEPDERRLLNQHELDHKPPGVPPSFVSHTADDSRVVARQESGSRALEDRSLRKQMDSENANVVVRQQPGRKIPEIPSYPATQKHTNSDERAARAARFRQETNSKAPTAKLSSFPYRSNRERLHSDHSNDISLYIEDVP